jgi:hypothetical protein
MEMTTVLRGDSIDRMEKFFKSHGTEESYIQTNLEAMELWCAELRGRPNPFIYDNEALEWIKDMVQTKPGDRPTALQLFSRIRGCKGDFIRTCCADVVASTVSSYQGSEAGGGMTGEIGKANSSHGQARRAEVADMKGASPPNNKRLGLGRIFRLDATRSWAGINTRLLKMEGSDVEERSGEGKDASLLNNWSRFAAKLTGRTEVMVCERPQPEAKTTPQTSLQQEASGFYTQHTTDRKTTEQSAFSTPSHRIGHMYDNITTMDDAIQVNGDVGRGDRDTPMTNRYTGVHSAGRSRQVNGQINDASAFLQLMG